MYQGQYVEYFNDLICLFPTTFWKLTMENRFFLVPMDPMSWQTDGGVPGWLWIHKTKSME